MQIMFTLANDLVFVQVFVRVKVKLEVKLRNK